MATTDEKSCLGCPSRLSPGETVATFGKSISAPTCGRFGYVLGRPGASNDQNNETEKMYAAGCSEYGKPRPSVTPDKLNLEVCLPDPDAREELGNLDPKKTMVKACAQCRNFIPDDKVAEELGWTAGLCAAKGRLIMGNRKVTEARGCQFKQGGRVRTKLDLPLLPLYTDRTMAAVASPAAPAEAVNPLDYPTDRDVEPEEAEQGIIAWRKIMDPESTGNFIMLPIFDPKSFDDDERSLIPQTSDKERPHLYHDHNGAVYQYGVLWMELDEVPFAWGLPGVGKTEICRHLAWLMQIPFYRFSIKESTELYELEGSKEFSQELGTYFRDGRFVKAWTSRSVAVVDEPNMGRPEVWAFLRPCFDNSKSLVLDSDGGRRMDRDGFCFVALGGNPAWSPLNVGTNPIGAADASRLVHIEFSYPPEPVERQIVREWVDIDGWTIDRTRLDLVFAVSMRVRELSDQGTLMMTWGVRENIKVARMLRWFAPVTAYRRAAGDYLEPEQREAFLDQVRAVLPDKLPPIEMNEEG